MALSYDAPGGATAVTGGEIDSKKPSNPPTNEAKSSEENQISSCLPSLASTALSQQKRTGHKAEPRPHGDSASPVGSDGAKDGNGGDSCCVNFTADNNIFLQRATVVAAHPAPTALDKPNGLSSDKGGGETSGCGPSKTGNLPTAAQPSDAPALVSDVFGTAVLLPPFPTAEQVKISVAEVLGTP